MEKKVAVLIPCYNEELTIRKVIRDFKEQLPQAEIYVYDNNSTDKTAEIAKSEHVIVRHEPRQGKGNVVRQMFLDIDADVYIMVDGDDTYPAAEVHQMIAAIDEGYDLVIGDRLSNGTYFSENTRAFHNFGNRLVRSSIQMLYNTKIEDIMTGYRVFSKPFVKSFPVLSKGFQIETELTIHAVDHNFRIKEIPISYKDRPEGSESKLNTYSDGMKVCLMIAKMFKDYRPLPFFTVVASLFILLGLIVGIPVVNEFIATGLIAKMPSAILATGLEIFGLLSFSTGLILDTVINAHKKQFELHLLQIYEGLNRDGK